VQEFGRFDHVLAGAHSELLFLANGLRAHRSVMRPQDIETDRVVNVPPNVPVLPRGAKRVAVSVTRRATTGC